MISQETVEVYVGMSADLIHAGHLNLLREASKYGRITVGVLTDAAVSSYKRVPFMSFDERAEIVRNLKSVHNVVAQETLSYKNNLLKFRPKFVVHGDDWKQGSQSSTRQEVIDTLRSYGGSLIEIPYTKGKSSTQLIDIIQKSNWLPDFRRNQLKKSLAAKGFIRAMEAHNGLSGLIVENTSIIDNEGFAKSFDAMWLSSLTDSSARGMPDIEAVDISSRLITLNEICQVTSKPIIFDADTGGEPEHLFYTLKSLQSLGVSAAIIEDKTGLKRNSLLGNDVPQKQETIENFCYKINFAKKAIISDDFLLIARIESLILDNGLEDALLRAENYVSAGANGIMIHSRSKERKEIVEFCKRFRQIATSIPLVVVPTTFNDVKEEELRDVGVNIVIYANHLLRSAYPAMKNVAESILKNSRSLEADNSLMPISEILKLIPDI